MCIRDSIQNLEQPFLIWACNCLVKFWRSPKNFKIQNFLGGIFFDKWLRIFHKKFWLLKFFGLRQNLTRQLQAQIKKGCSKFWICHTFKNFLNCGDNSTFKKRWADNVLKKISFHTRPIFDVKILEFWKKKSSKFFLIDSPLMTPATIFSHMKFWISKKNPDSSNFWRSPKNFKMWVVWHALEEYFWNWYTNHIVKNWRVPQRLDLKYHPS